MLLASVCMLHRIGLHGSLASRASMRWIWCKDSEALGGKGGPNGAKADAALSANRKSDGGVQLGQLAIETAKNRQFQCVTFFGGIYRSIDFDENVIVVSYQPGLAIFFPARSGQARANATVRTA